MPESFAHGEPVRFVKWDRRMNHKLEAWEGRVGRVSLVVPGRDEYVVEFEDSLVSRFWINGQRLEKVSEETK